MSKELKLWCNLQYDTKSFTLAEDHHLIRLQTKVECEGIIKGGPWFMTSQILAVESWVLDFVPRTIVVRQTVI